VLDRLRRPRLRVRVADGATAERALAGAGTHDVGPVAVDIDPSAGGWRWAVAATAGTVEVSSVAVVWDDDLPPGTAVFRHGYQSWSPSDVARLGVDRDPSATPGTRTLVRATHHADPAVVDDPHELRSELVTVHGRGGDGGGERYRRLGFAGGDRHDGTFRFRPAGAGAVAEVVAEAHLGGAALGEGDRRELHPVTSAEGDDALSLLDGWAAETGAACGARTGAPYQVGWCSWYQWFHDVSEADIRRTLALAADWPFDVFQVDDGYQPAIGDWLATNERFTSPLDELAAAIRAGGRTAGIWMAPFLAAPGSEVARLHPDWLARWHDGSPLVGNVNAAWGGAVHVIDTTRPEVLDHLASVAASLAAAGYRYLKLDFTYAAALPGRFGDPSATPAARVRAGLDAVRRGAGEGVFLLGCGLPLGPGIGAVDGMRIGPDVAPWWEPPAGTPALAGYEGSQPATANAWRATVARAFQHRRLWLNDPDCLMLRTADTRMTPADVRTWADAVAASGGMAIVSDDLALLGAGERALLDEVVATGRAVDDAARTGPAPRLTTAVPVDPPDAAPDAADPLL
jgi:alpha-galactosidase